MKKSAIVCAVFFLLSISWVAVGENAQREGSYFDMSLEELVEAMVVSASRSEQKLSDLAVPVSIITAEDIHYSGITTITELLQFTPGVDVRRVDRNHYQVGVRGFQSRYSDRTLVLINGRNALNPVFGAPDWGNLPILIGDIERIEVVRGPGGAVWGANAYTGVINIITKKPKDTENLFSTQINEFGDSYSHLRFVGKDDRFSWKISAGYENFENSDAAGAARKELPNPAFLGFVDLEGLPVDDFSRSWRFDTEFGYFYDENTALSFGVAHSCSKTGDLEVLLSHPDREILNNQTRLFARLEHRFDENTIGHLQWYGNYVVNRVPSHIGRYAYYENDLEGQINFQAGDDHEMTVGGNLRWTRITNRNGNYVNEFVFTNSTYDEYWAGIFLVDRFDWTDRLSIETQVRLDRYNKSTTDYSMRLAALYALDDEKDHVLRASFGRAFRAPGLVLRQSTLSGLGGLINNFSPGDTLEHETTYTLEGGYTGRLSEHLTFRLNSYYQRMEHLLGVVLTSPGFGVTNGNFQNVDGADTYGTECELNWKSGPWDVSAWYANNRLITDHKVQIIRAYYPAPHKAGITTRYAFGDGLMGNVNYAYDDAVLVNTTDGAVNEGGKVSHRVDLTLSKHFAQGRGEFMIGVSDLLNKTQSQVYDTGYLTSFETPGRTFFTRLQYKF